MEIPLLDLLEQADQAYFEFAHLMAERDSIPSDDPRLKAGEELNKQILKQAEILIHS